MESLPLQPECRKAKMDLNRRAVPSIIACNIWENTRTAERFHKNVNQNDGTPPVF